MKKWYAMVLTLLLLCMLSSTAWASEMYDTYGPMDDWSDEAWRQSDSWSDEQWEDYWLGEEEAYEREREQHRLERRLELGLPDIDGVNVKLNETFLQFPNNKPRLVDGSVYLPLRDFFAAAGIKAEFSYVSSTGVVTAVLADKRTLTATLNETTILATTQEGEEYEIYSYDMPLMLDGSIYLSWWILCDFLGWDESFDRYNELLYLIEPEPLITQLDSNFTIYNRLFQSPATSLNKEEAYKFSGSMALSGTLYGDKKSDTVSASLDYNGVIQGLNLDMSFAIKLNLDQMKDSLLSSLSADDWKKLKIANTGQGRVILDSAEGSIYLQSNLLPLIDERLSAKDWLKFENAFTEEDILSASNSLWELSSYSVGHLIYSSALSNSYYSYDSDVYAAALGQSELWQALLGDANFKVERKNGYDVYTLQLDQQKLKQALEESDFELPGGSLFSYLFGYYSYYDSETTDFNHELRFRERSDGSIEDLQMSANTQTKSYLPVSYTLAVDYDRSHLKADLEIKGRYFGKINLSLNGSITETTEAPATAPPAGSNIVLEQELDSPRIYLF